MARDERRETQAAYARQRQAIEATCDAFVSPFDIARDSDGRELSYCTWAEGVAAWLPKADCIALTGTREGKRWFLVVPWRAVTEACQAALEPIPGLAPPRFRTLEWPDATQLSRLADLAVIRR